MDYPFIGSFRARAIKVVDGDTLDLMVDLGFHSFRLERFRILRIDAPEIRGETKGLGEAAKSFLQSLVLVEGEWPLKINTKKDPDSFGRWLAEVFIWKSDGIIGSEVSVGTVLVETGHAVYKTY